MAGNLANLTPWPKGVSGNPKGRPRRVSLMAQALQTELDAIDEATGEPNYRVIARAWVRDAKKRGLDRQMLVDREVPKVEIHELDVYEADDSGLADRLAALAPRSGANGVDRHTNGSAEEEPA